MKRPLGCAIDFGTTNSRIALVFDDSIELVDLEQKENRHAVRSVLYLHRLGQAFVGESAIAQYTTTARNRTRDELDSRLITGLKYMLTDPTMRTESWGRSFTVASMIAEVLKFLKKRAEDVSGGEPIKRVMIGHPVEFARIGDTDGDRPLESQVSDQLANQAKQTLRDAARAAGFTDISLLAEPEGALATLNPARDASSPCQFPRA
jgi:hypothetical chaperone protein